MNQITPKEHRELTRLQEKHRVAVGMLVLKLKILYPLETDWVVMHIHGRTCTTRMKVCGHCIYHGSACVKFHAKKINGRGWIGRYIPVDRIVCMSAEPVEL